MFMLLIIENSEQYLEFIFWRIIMLVYDLFYNNFFSSLENSKDMIIFFNVASY